MSAVRITIFRLISFFALIFFPGVLSGQWRIVDSILYAGNIIDTSDYIPSFYSGALDYNLMIASSKGYTTEITRLIGKGADINAETTEGATPLIFAVSNNRLEAVKTLLEYSPQLNKATSSSETPLLIAVKNRNFDITEVLIRAGADINYSDRYGATALNHAALYGYLDIVDLLLYYDASIDTKSLEGITPLLASIRAGYDDVADLLIQRGASLEESDNKGFTPFLMASYYGDTLIMDILYKKGADIFAVTNLHHNALTLTILADHKIAAELLFNMSSKWDEQENNALNPYRVASKYQRSDMIDILKKNNMPGKLKYEIDQVSVNLSSRFFLHDIYSGLSLSFKEPYLNGGFIIGCDTKLWYTRVLIKKSENLFYQYYDKGSVAYAGLFKEFTLTNLHDRLNYSFSTSLLAGYYFGNTLKGTLMSSDNMLKIIPAISFKISKMNFSLNLGMEYIKTDFYHNGPLWFRAGCSYNYFFDKVRTLVKPIKWY